MLSIFRRCWRPLFLRSARRRGTLLAVVVCSACSTAVDFFPEENVIDYPGEDSSQGGDITGGQDTGGAEQNAGAMTGGTTPMGGAGDGDGTGGAVAEPKALAINTDAPCPDDVSLTNDLLEIVFDSDNFTLMISERETADSEWPLAVPLPDVGIPGTDTGAEISRDGLALWWSSSRPGSAVGNFNLWFASRPSRDAPWGPAAPVDELNTDDLEAYPTVTDDGLFMVFVSIGADLSRDLFSSARNSLSEAWGPRTALTALNTAGTDQAPHLSADGLTLYISSARSGGVGGADLYVAQRANRTDSFSAVRALDEFNTPLGEQDPWETADGRTFVFGRFSDEPTCEFFIVER